MNDLEKKWFCQLTERNTKIWETLCLPEIRGLLDSTIYKYNDTAHFVYELLQNADDAEAKEVEFELHRDKLIFTHNGSIRFSVSNPENIEEDRKNGKLGHVNSITSFNFSNKETDSDIKQNKIGKFGIGFKSVYRYTSTPCIYDDNICFKIENMIIPSIIEDTSLLQKEKTVFVIPFNSDHITAEDAYSEIQKKLRTLNRPQLFLNNIQRIFWKADNEAGLIEQTVMPEHNIHGCHAEPLSIADINGEQSSIIKISRDVELSECGSHRISIAYYLDKEGRINTGTKRRIYCFFPVSESINTCFALHAPFMLTENRQNLLPDNPVNKQLLKELAKLAADSLLVLRDIGLKEERHLLDDRLKTLTASDVEQLSNWEALVEETLFEKEYKRVFEFENIFLSSNGKYLSSKETYWATSEMRSLISVEQLKELTRQEDFCLCSCTNYLSDVKGLGIDGLTDNRLNDILSVEFLQKQTDEWLDKFYRYLYYKRLVGDKLENGKKQIGVFRYKPIFKTDAGTFVAALYKDGQKQLFKYTEGITTPNNSVNQELLKKSEGLRLLVKELEIKEADRYDYIQQRLKEKQTGWSKEESNKFLTTVIRYWKECGDDDKRRIRELLENELWLKCDKLFDSDKNWYAKTSILYKNEKRQLLEDYYRIAGESLRGCYTSKYYEEQKIAEVKGQCIFDEEYYYTTVAEIGREVLNEFIDWLGIACYPRIVHDDKNGHIIDSITRILYIMPQKPEWQDKMSHRLWEVLCYHVGRREKDISRMSYKYPDLKNKYNFYDKNLLDILKSQPWLFINGKLMRLSDDVYRETLVHEEYNGDGSVKLMNILGVKTSPSQSTDKSEILANYLQIDSRKEDSTLLLQKIEQLLEALNKTKPTREETISGETEATTVEELTLEGQAKSAEKYSYKWLRLLMSAEAMISGEDDEEKKTKAVKIEFRSIAKEGDIIKLDNPSRYVPASLEDVDNLEVKFYNRDDSYKSITFDAASVKDNVLLLKVKNKQHSDIEALQIPNLSYAAISVEHPIELARNWKRLIDGFGKAGKHDTFSFQKEIRPDLNFIFGPPGTGKTYTLADRIISMIDDGAKRILVLTPTNKACDVITQEVIKHSDSNCHWLYRFVKTMEDDLEDYVLFHDTEISTEQACIVSTIARYAYDYCAEGNLKDLDWDYVIVDEASMIPLYQIIAPIFNKKTQNILIAGDPFQIQPIVRCDVWKDENIYTMLGLNDFENPQTYPVNSKIETLKTQYRAVPDIGELFSRYSYKGILQHDRTAQAQRKLELGLDAKPLNLITFPCSKESQFCPLKLKSSNIQVYSVIFVVEFLRYISNKISEMDLERQVNIGVVGPYIAEIQAINKMQEQLVPHHNNVSIICGSAHGFQGDECDIVIAVMNPPASGLIRKTQQTFINNKNILNVSVSRAKDYLFVVMPDSEYTYSDKLLELNELKKIITTIGCKQYSSREMERIMFGRYDEIKENTFVTSHQMANVYTDFSKKYEIRIDENAIDIQVNGNEG